MAERGRPNIVVLHEYLVDIRRVQFSSLYVLAENEEAAEAKADALYQAGEILDWDDDAVEVWNVEETA